MNIAIKQNAETHPVMGRVFIVDSSITMGEVCTEILRSVGADCRTACDGNEAWKILLDSINDEPFDILIMAWELPGICAVELMQLVRSHPLLAELPIIIFSEHIEEEIWTKIPNRYKCDLLHKHDVELLPEHVRFFIEQDKSLIIPGKSLDMAIQSAQKNITSESREKILLVDDSLSIIETYSHLLIEAGYEVFTAMSVDEGEELVRLEYPSLVLIDYYMPKVNGDELCRRILTDKNADTVVVMFSERHDIVEAALNVGAIDVIYKDDPLHIFMLRVNAIMQSIQSQRNHRQLNLLLKATENLGVGVMTREDGVLMADNPTMANFAQECHGLINFDGEREIVELIDRNDGRRVFQLNLLNSTGNNQTLLVQDITERKQVERKLVQLAKYDVLTGLANRSLFYDSMLIAIQYAHRHKNKFALLYVDLDFFKNVNDSLGHDAGDMLLMQMAKRIKRCVRDIDIVARIGGDEFAIIMNDIVNLSPVAQAAERMLNLGSQAFMINAAEVFVSLSIGVVLYPACGIDVETLTRAADTAMYKAKSMGRNNYQFFAQEMQLEAIEKSTMENALRKSFNEGKFYLNYQPQIDTISGELAGLEALIRWDQQQWPDLSTEKFIRLAEERGLISRLGEWVLNRACQQAQNWRIKHQRDFRIAVNVSPRQLINNPFDKTLMQILEVTGLPPNCMDVEITENAVMQKSEETIPLLQRIHDMGINISMDDFGTGYSSLSYLKKLPINTLKIDRAFIQDIGKDHNSEAVIKAILAMAETLNIQVVAEGVDSVEQVDFLKQNNCQFLQGYLLSKPLRESVVPDVLHDNFLVYH